MDRNHADTHGLQAATLRFATPDHLPRAEDRAIYAMNKNKDIHELDTNLHNARNNPELITGADGLDVHGFTYIKHQSALSEGNRWYVGSNMEDIYLREVEELVCRITGAKCAVVNNCAFRRKPVTMQNRSDPVIMKGSVIDKMLTRLPKDRCLVAGKAVASSLEPVRAAHVDYSTKGLMDLARYSRKDIAELGKTALEAEDLGNNDVPRYAVYGVWRPIGQIRRDPLAVLDWKTLDPTELETVHYRAPSGVNESGEYIVEAYNLLPPKRPEEQKWYWTPNQQEDEVLMIKFADTGAKGDMAKHCPHMSPIIPETEHESPRSSVECRVIAFW